MANVHIEAPDDEGPGREGARVPWARSVRGPKFPLTVWCVFGSYFPLFVEEVGGITFGYSIGGRHEYFS